MSFPQYWDLSERARAELSHEDVGRYIDAELMSKGVLKVQEPELEEEPTCETRERPFFGVRTKVDHWRSAHVVFATQEAAEAFLRLNPCVVNSEYLEGDNVEFAKSFDPKIEGCSVMLEADYVALKSTLQARAAVRASNKKRREDYETAKKAQDAALSGLWEDYYRCRNKRAQLQRVAETFKEYTRIAGDARTALKFLEKAFSMDLIEESNEWFSLGMPLIAVPPCEPDPKATEAALQI